MKKIAERPFLPKPPGSESQYIATMMRCMTTVLGEIAYRLNGVLPKDGTEDATGVVGFTNLKFPYAALTLANGANSNLVITNAYHRVVGPTGAFSVSGFVAGEDGQVLILQNAVAQNMTITNDATSTAANRILTLTGADVTPTGICLARFIYSAADTRWILMGTQG